MKLGRAQITDDSEMAMCILNGIMETIKNGSVNEVTLDLDHITKYFGMWCDVAFGKSFQKFNILQIRYW